MNGYTAAYNFIKPHWDKNAYHFSLYTGMLPKRKYKSEANFHVPYVATLLDNVHPLLTARFPEGSVIARNDRDRNAATLMNEILKYTFQVNTFDWTLMMQQKASMLYGNAWVKVCWDYSEDGRDHAKIVSLSSFDVIPHPRKVSMDDRWPVYVRSEMTKGEMIEQGWDKKAIKALGPSKLNDKTYRDKQLQSLGYANSPDGPSESQDDLYEVVEVHGKMQFNDDEPERMGYLVLVNREVLVNTEPFPGKQPFESPYNHNKIPLAQLPYNSYPNVLLAESFIDPVASQQEELNALENMKADNYKRRNNPPLIIRRSGEIDISTLKYVNSTPWEVNDVDDITQFTLPDLAPSIESQQNQIRQIMQARTGANDVLLATEDASIQAGNTATGASIANENTKTRFKPQARSIDLFVERITELCINLYQDPRYFDREMAIPIADEEGQFTEELIRPDQVSGDLQFKVNSSSSLAESNEQLMTKYLNLRQLYGQDPTYNMAPIDEKIFDAADDGLYNKVKRGADSLKEDAATKLQQLVSVAKSPGFASQPEAQKSQVLTQIQKLRQVLSGEEPMQEAPASPQQSEMSEIPQ